MVIAEACASTTAGCDNGGGAPDARLVDATTLCRVRRMKKLLLLLIVLAIAGVAARQLTSS